MTSIQAFILGIIQGITEFLPISSSGHLVLTPHIFNWDIPTDQVFVFDVMVQMGTLVAVIIYYWKDVINISKDFVNNIFKPQNYNLPNMKLGFFLLIATVPAGLCGLFFKDFIEGAFANPLMVAIFLLFTALLMIFAEWIGKRRFELSEISWLDALGMGIFQALALFPGVSRSGATLSAGMFRHLKRPDAARFSFLMSIPVMLAAGLLTSIDLFKIADLSSFIGPMAIGFITSAVVGYFAIRWLIKFLSTYPLYYFSIYLILLSVSIMILN